MFLGRREVCAPHSVHTFNPQNIAAQEIWIEPPVLLACRLLPHATVCLISASNPCKTRQVIADEYYWFFFGMCSIIDPVTLMPNLVPTPPSETLHEVSRTIRELQDALENLDVSIERPSRSARLSRWLRKNRGLTSFTALVFLIGIAAGSYLLGLKINKLADLKIDTHIASAIEPAKKELQSAESNTRRLEEKLVILQCKVLAQQIAAIPVSQLREHRDELRDARTQLAAVDADAPGFWPTTFQLITLLSRATSAVEIEKPKEIVISNVSDFPFAGELGERIVLVGEIKNTVFNDAVVRLDPEVHLQNVTFNDCVIIFPDTPKPSSSLRQIAAQLLSSNLLHATIRGS
jgi:hypothetical protein